MKELQEKVEKMLNGEKKRREIAIEWLGAVDSAIAAACLELFGDSGETNSEPTQAVEIPGSSIYYRYGTHYGQNENEYHGFYFSEQWAYWGKDVEGLRGKDFWDSMRVIMNWLPVLEKRMDIQGANRDNIISKLIVKHHELEKLKGEK